MVRHTVSCSLQILSLGIGSSSHGRVHLVRNGSASQNLSGKKELVEGLGLGFRS